MTQQTEQSARRRILFNFRIILGSILVMLTIIVVGVFAMKSIEQQLQQAYRASGKLKSVQAENLEAVSLLSGLIGADGASRLSMMEQISQLRQSLPLQLQQLESQLGQWDEYSGLLKEVNVVFSRYDQAVMLMEGNRKEEAQLLFQETIQPAGMQVNAYIKALNVKLDERVKKLSGLTDFVLNSSLISLLILGIAQFIVAFSISRRIIWMFRRILREIREGVVVISSSSAEIQTTVAEVSAGAAETASSIAETTSTVEEIRQTSNLSNERAQSLIARSQRASEMAEKGLESSERMSIAIKRLQEQMSNVVNVVDHLASQNRSIGEITSTVSDIADQSNLLAVNASIEAARAGEHGRGFSVVAQEIRNLSEQSKKSTIQVRQILNDIQKSVENSVSLIHQSIQTVESSGSLVADNQQVVRLLSETVEDAMQAAMQIASSSQQQLAGMDQIVPAMDNIRLASEQNLVGIRQMHQAIEDVNQMGRSLNGLMEKYDM
ncbi:MAG: methyl-accepting chemotaxis protein [Bacteroidia bacterium]|jgi:methyl-accepting chemotaxis protein|nr:methyl-accepting chemotaxis protein [Bacteroidia bacterium]